MPKQHKKGVGADLVGSPDGLVKLMIPDISEQKWVIKELSNEGPPHKQVLTAQLLNRLHKYIKAIEKSTGTTFELQKGSSIESYTHEDEEEVTMPVEFPVNGINKAAKEKIVEAVSHAPLHELLAYTMCLQVIEWGIKNVGVSVES